MLKKLRVLLPEFTITKNGPLFDIKRQDKFGDWHHFPVIVNRTMSADEIATSTNNDWNKYV